MPAPLPIITPKKCGRLPGAGLPKLALVGFALYQAISSFIVFAGWLALTESANWKLATCATGAKSTSGSYGSFANTIGASTVTTIGVSIRTLPSAGEFFTASATIRPPAPGRFSTTTGCFSSSFMRSAIRRAAMSAEPPGAKPTSSRTGLSTWASAAPAVNAKAVEQAGRGRALAGHAWQSRSPRG